MAMAVAPPPTSALCANCHQIHLSAPPPPPAPCYRAVLSHRRPEVPLPAPLHRARLLPRTAAAASARRLLAPHLPRHPASRGVLRDLALRHPLSSLLLLPSLLADGPHIPSRLPVIVAQSARTHDAVRMFNQMRTRLAPDAYACTALLTVLAKAQMMAGAHRVFDEMAKPGFTPSTRTSTTPCCTCTSRPRADESLLKKLCEDGKTKVDWLLNEMDRRKVKADHVTCNTLISAYCKRGDMASACKVRKKMESGLQLDQFTYKALIHGLGAG
ncbi:hypothetical protein BS78_03G088300 [Paspalum vaginatum]|nr:hypothetical protein BS78_03G088300 [Paspalum vaginatum]